MVTHLAPGMAADEQRGQVRGAADEGGLEEDAVGHASIGAIGGSDGRQERWGSGPGRLPAAAPGALSRLVWVRGVRSKVMSWVCG